MNAADLAQQIASDLQALPVQSTAPMRKVRRGWSAKRRHESPNDVLAVAAELCEQHGYRWIAYELILFHSTALTLINEDNIERLAGQMSSWSDVDQFGVLLAGPAWRAGQIGDSVIHAWARSPDRWWRRAALVSTVPLNIRSQGGKGNIPRTLAVCERLMVDRDDMVTKAMSWALRELIVHDCVAVKEFIAKHDDVLSARVKRKVQSKLITGLKNPCSALRLGSDVNP